MNKKAESLNIVGGIIIAILCLLFIKLFIWPGREILMWLWT